MDLDLGLATSFLMLVQERHFGRAAARLHLTSSGLTKQVQQLERQLGVVLIENGVAGVPLTPAGLRFAQEAAPLLAHADAVRRAARLASGSPILRIGFPAGSAVMWRRIGMADVAGEVRRTFPQARLVCREFPLSDLGAALRNNQIDLLCANAAAQDTSLVSTPLRIAAELMGVVRFDHRLADAGAIDVGEFGDELMLFNPSVPVEWMNAFWLADIRPRRAARLAETTESDQWRVLRRAVSGPAVTVTLTVALPMLGARLRPVRLIGAAPLPMQIARRLADRRAKVRVLIDALAEIAPRAWETATRITPALGL